MTIIEEFLKNKPKSNKLQEILLLDRINEFFDNDPRILKVRKGAGFKKRKNILKKNIKVNFLLNCLRTYFNLSTLKLEEEFYSTIEKAKEIEKSPELIKLEKALKMNKALKRKSEIERITKEIEDLKSGVSKKQHTTCQRCSKEMTQIQGMYMCHYCNIQGQSVEGVSYLQSTSSSSSGIVSGMEKLSLKVQGLTEEKYKKFARSLVEKIDEMTKEINYFGDIDDFRQDIWRIANENKNKTNEEVKIILAGYLLNDARRRGEKNLKKVLNKINFYLKIKKNLEYMLDEEEEEQNNIIRLNLLLTTDDEKIKKEEILSKLGEIPNELQMAALVKFILVNVRKISSSDAEKLIKNIIKTKYAKQYKKIKKLFI